MIEDSWVRWKEMYRSKGVGQFVLDGAGPEYRGATRRVLFVLKEPHGTQWKDVREQLGKPPRGMWYALARWAYGILMEFPEHSTIDKKECEWALRHVAVINLKKEGGGSKADDSVLHAIAHRDRDILREQVAELAPHIVIACGTFDQLVWLLDLAIDPVRPHGAIAWDPARTLGVAPFRHPALSHGTKDYHRLKDLLVPLLT